MPYVPCPGGQIQPEGFRAVLSVREQAEFDPFGVRREQREVNPGAVAAGAKRVRFSRLRLRRHALHGPKIVARAEAARQLSER